MTNTRYRGDCPIPLANMIADIWKRFQAELFPNLAQNLGPLTANHQRFVTFLDMKPVAAFVKMHSLGRGRPLSRRCFMTGGTYTPTNTVIANGSTGCFSISGLSGQDIRNCLYGRTSFGASGNSEQNTFRNNATRTSLGVAN
ncbi:MAG: hypothetical protein OXE94_08000 [Aestuariivita sp.]|nr:hypothetical protein [Aestuariivita sp.]